MGDYGMKIMLPGYDSSVVPNSAANIKKFALVTTVNLLKMKQFARVSIADTVTTTIAHGLAYKPLFWVYMRNASSQMVPIYHINSTAAYVDSTNLKITNNNGATRDFFYYIFYDPA